MRDGSRSGLLVTQQDWETINFFEHAGQGHFQTGGLARSESAVLGLGDQAWPCPCDWDGDGDLDLLIGGGYGWPRILINDGTNQRPAYREAQELISEGKPIRITRNEILGTHNWHDMGYSYPAYVDWDSDGLPDLMLANETNRIFWHKNIGTRQEPRFGPREQLICDGFPDSTPKRERSAALADDPQTPNAPYPLEEDQPFYWRTGPAFADFDGDGLLDFVTADGRTRQATLFAQYRDDIGSLRLRKKYALKLTDGRAIDHSLVEGSRGWTESYRAVDWDGDGLVDLVYSQAGLPSGGSIQLLRNVGSSGAPSCASQADASVRQTDQHFRARAAPLGWRSRWRRSARPAGVRGVERVPVLRAQRVRIARAPVVYDHALKMSIGRAIRSLDSESRCHRRLVFAVKLHGRIPYSHAISPGGFSRVGGFVGAVNRGFDRHARVEQRRAERGGHVNRLFFADVDR